MKKIYESPELEIKSFKLTKDILERSGETAGEIGGGGLGGGDSSDIDDIDIP